jgi:hypothetical protein
MVKVSPGLINDVVSIVREAAHAGTAEGWAEEIAYRINDLYIAQVPILVCDTCNHNHNQYCTDADYYEKEDLNV